MADLQKILGTMLATGMAGHSGRNVGHIGSVLGRPGMMGMSTRRSGSSFKQTAGLAALGYLAYRAYQDHQKNNQARSGGSAPRAGGNPWGDAPAGQSGSAPGSSGGSSGVGGILGSIFGGGAAQSGSGSGSGSGGGSLMDRLSGVLQNRSAAQSAPSGRDEGAYPELAMEDQEALLLIRAMITAANADGVISADERHGILSALDEAGAGPEERRIVEHELNNPQPVDALLKQVRDPETAEQVYMASVMAVAEQSDAERAYLQYLASRLNIDPKRRDEIHRAA